MRRGCLVLLAVGALAVAHAAKSSSSSEQLLELTDSTLQKALNEHKLMLVTIGVKDCQPCALYEKRLKQAQASLRVKSTGAVTLAKMTIESQDSPVIANIVQGQLSLPKLLIFRDGEAMDFDAEPTKEGIVEVMLREMSRENILTLKSVKQTERFLHLDSWSTQHADEEKPPRVVGFFPSNATAGYAVFKEAASKLQGMMTFGEVFDPALQKKFLGKPAGKTIVQVVKSDRRERTLTYGGPLAVAPLARWVATHSLSIVQDLTTESSIEAHMARGVPVFLLLMPDEYEDALSDMMPAFKKVAAKVRPTPTPRPRPRPGHAQATPEGHTACRMTSTPPQPCRTNTSPHTRSAASQRMLAWACTLLATHRVCSPSRAYVPTPRCATGCSSHTASRTPSRGRSLRRACRSRPARRAPSG